MKTSSDSSFATRESAEVVTLRLPQAFVFGVTLSLIAVALFFFRVVFPELADSMSWATIGGIGTVLAAFYSWVGASKRSEGWLGVIAFLVIPPLSFLGIVMLITGSR